MPIRNDGGGGASLTPEQTAALAMVTSLDAENFADLATIKAGGFAGEQPGFDAVVNAGVMIGAKFTFDGTDYIYTGVQSDPPILLTVPSIADRTTIAAELVGDQQYRFNVGASQYYLIADPANPEGVLIGPFTGGGGGSQGPAGADGQDGPPGADGQDGADGLPGAQGIQGPAGADGVDGQDGADGQDGERQPTYTITGRAEADIGTPVAFGEIPADQLRGATEFKAGDIVDVEYDDPQETQERQYTADGVTLTVIDTDIWLTEDERYTLRSLNRVVYGFKSERRPFNQVPMYGGNCSAAIEAIWGGSITNTQVLMFDDSQGTDGGNGTRTIPAMNLEAIARFGRPTHAPWQPNVSYGGTNPQGRFLGRGSTLGTDDIPAAETSNYPPNYQARISNPTSNFSGMAHALDFRGAFNDATDRGEDLFDVSDGYIYEGLYQRNVGAEADEVRMRLVQNGSTLSYSSGLLGALDKNSIGLALNTGTDQEYVQFDSDLIAHNDAAPITTVYSFGVGQRNGLYQATGRYRHPTRSHGTTFLSASFGGGRADTWVANHGNCYPWFAATGPWACGVIAMSANHLNDTADDFKAHTMTLINWARDASRFGPDWPIILVADGFRNGQAGTEYPLFPGIYYEIAQELDNVGAVNYWRAAYRFGGNASLLKDSVHLTPNAASWRSRVLFNLFESVGV